MNQPGDCSYHARVRMQQRGVSAEGLDLLLRFGRSAHSQSRRELVYLDHAARRAALRECGRAVGSLIDRLAGMCVVVGKDGVIVTVRPRGRRVQHK